MIFQIFSKRTTKSRWKLRGTFESLDLAYKKAVKMAKPGTDVRIWSLDSACWRHFENGVEKSGAN